MGLLFSEVNAVKTDFIGICSDETAPTKTRAVSRVESFASFGKTQFLRSEEQPPLCFQKLMEGKSSSENQSIPSCKNKEKNSSDIFSKPTPLSGDTSKCGKKCSDSDDCGGNCNHCHSTYKQCMGDGK